MTYEEFARDFWREMKSMAVTPALSIGEVCTITLNTTQYRSRRPEERDIHIHYLIDRLLSGEEVARSALEHYGIRVTIREAVSPEIFLALRSPAIPIEGSRLAPGT
jgi:hypothetical protein